MTKQQSLIDCLSLTEAAQRLGVSVRTIRRQIEGGGIPSIKIGRRHVIRNSSLAEFLTASEARVV